MATDTIKVKANTALLGNRVALHDIDAAHPEGTVFVAGDRVVEVGRTQAVDDALNNRLIVEVKGGKAVEPAGDEAPQETKAQREARVKREKRAEAQRQAADQARRDQEQKDAQNANQGGNDSAGSGAPVQG